MNGTIRAARARIKEAEDAAIKHAINNDIQNIEDAQKEHEEKHHERVVIRPVVIPSTNEKGENDKSRLIPIIQECDSVIEEGANDVIGPKISFLTPRQFQADALYHIVGRHIESYSSNFVPDELTTSIGSINMQIPLEEITWAGVVNPETGETLTK